VTQGVEAVVGMRRSGGGLDGQEFEQPLVEDQATNSVPIVKPSNFRQSSRLTS
jgi:hypothetical protein